MGRKKGRKYLATYTYKDILTFINFLNISLSRNFFNFSQLKHFGFDIGVSFSVLVKMCFLLHSISNFTYEHNKKYNIMKA